MIVVGIDCGGNWSGGNGFGLDLIGWELWVYQQKSKNKQFFIDRVRNDRVRNYRVRYDRARYDRVRNNRGLEIIGSQ